MSDPSRSRRWRDDPATSSASSPPVAGDDHFDRLPDPLLLVIFTRIGDVKALGRCSLVSRRFHFLVPLVDSVVVRVDCVISEDPSPSFSPSPSSSPSPSPPPPSRSRGTGGGGGVLSHLARLVLGGLAKPLQALGQILSPSSSAVAAYRRLTPSPSSVSSSAASTSSSSGGDVSHHSPSEVLRSFKELRRLRIELPAGELGVDDGVLLKWKADFGSTLGSCVILGASSVSTDASSSRHADSTNDVSGSGTGSSSGSDDSGSIPESFYTNGGLKLRVVWTISSLIAASARHYLLQPIITDHAMLESLDLTDADGQGVLTMDKWQLQELRVRPVSASGSSHRTLMPALRMRLWYAPHIELPGGLVLKGATLVAIRPSEEAPREGGGGAGSSGGCWVSNAFEEPYRTAVRMLLKRRTYSLEMNSF